MTQIQRKRNYKESVNYKSLFSVKNILIQKQSERSWWRQQQKGWKCYFRFILDQFIVKVDGRNKVVNMWVMF